MPVTAIVGAQWGDEGKGKIVDLLAQEADLVSRFGGGSNAGHTIVNELGTFKLHSLPSGVFNPATTNIVGTGTVVDFDSLAAELDQVMSAGIDSVNLIVSDRAHVIMPYHKMLDRLKDDALGANRIGTTGQGIGPAYVDKADRIGVQAGELLDLAGIESKLRFVINQKRRTVGPLYPEAKFDLDDTLDRVRAWRSRFGPNIKSTLPAIRHHLAADSRILLEGQLGIMRDLDWGTYPFVTSSTTFAAGAGSGAGIPPRLITDVVGVVKAYTSAVGTGPVPSELHGEEAHSLREIGREYGATTGRPRRVGWLDAVALRYAAEVGAFTRLAVTKLDVLDRYEAIRVAVAYRVDGRETRDMPHPSQFGRVEPIYETLAGWNEPTTSAAVWDDLPQRAQQYVERISELAGVPVSLVSVGSARHETVGVATPESVRLV